MREGIAGARTVVPQLADIEDDFAGERVPLRFDALGVSLDFGRVFADAEYARRRVDNWVPDMDGWALVLGTRVGSVRPYGFVSGVFETHGDRRIDLPGGVGLDALEAGHRSVLRAAATSVRSGSELAGTRFRTSP